MRKRAAELGETIRAEDGVANGVRVINQTLGGSPTNRWSRPGYQERLGD